MTTNEVQKSLLSVLDDVHAGRVDVYAALRNINALFAAGAWPYTKSDSVKLDQLTNDEFYALLKWSQNARKDYTGPVLFAKDMREVFPGLSISAAARYWVMVTA